MLTVHELNEVKGLLHYLNENMLNVKPADFSLIDANGEDVAQIGHDPAVQQYVLKTVRP